MNTLLQLPASLEAISAKRKGGVYNIRGINYQILYTIYRLLEEFTSETGVNKVFQLEGIEDLDFYTIEEKSTTNEFIQLKCKNENLSADDFVKNILLNLLEVYDTEPDSSFLTVTNTHLAGGKLQDLAIANKSGKPLSTNAQKYWYEKVLDLRSNYSINTIANFLSKIHFVKKTEDELYKGSLNLLIDQYNVVNGNEFRFFQALFYSIHSWSIEKKVVSKLDIDLIIQSVFDDVIDNRAIRNDWIKLVDFSKTGDSISNNGYFEGKAARPFHIAASLPIERLKWEKDILESIKNFDVTLIKASSGQGKSTLAWRATMALSQKGFSVYELMEIGEDGVHDVFLFIESRLKIGIVPIIVIDGLNDAVKDWIKLAKKAQILRGVKFVITSREEDWFRYGNGASQINLKPISVNLDVKEATAIYSIFQKQKKIHPKVGDWQIAWEKVSQSKLLIEFVYLITQGQMIHERMIEQLHTFQEDKNEASKKSILRLVSVADMLNIRLPTITLLDFVSEKSAFQGDEATVLQSLKNEYHLQIQDREYIEGLHPVRSRHISDILHETLPLSKTLIDLLSVIEPQSLFTLISNAPLLIQNEASKNIFLEKLAIAISEKSYEDIVTSIIAIFSTDAHIHWLENKLAYDEFPAGGIMIYAISKAPFSNLPENQFDSLNEYFPSLKENLNKISKPDMTRSNTSLFIKALKRHLDIKPAKSDWSKIMHLERWYQRFNLDSKILLEVSVDDLERLFNSMSTKEFGEILYGVYLLKSPVYTDFYNKNKSKLINKLRIETKTLIVEPKENNLDIRYFIDKEDKANEQSVSRIETIGYSLPHYKTFNTAGIYFPNPLFKALRKHDESIKNAHWDGWLSFDNFSTRGNRIWLDRIESYYEFETQYEWQKYWFDYRCKMVDFLKQTSKFIETRMTKMSQFDIESKQWVLLRKDMIEYRKQEKMIRYDNNFKKEDLKDDMKHFKGWETPLNNVFNQTFPDAQNINGWRIYKININDALNNLQQMQEAFDIIGLRTAQYFDTSDLKNQELPVYAYFSELVEFFYNEFHLKNVQVYNSRKDVKSWKDTHYKINMRKLEKVKEDFENINPYYELLLPKSILLEGDCLDNVILGIRNITPQEFPNDLPLILEGLIGLSNLKARFYYLILIDNEIEANKFAFRFSEDFLDELKLITKGEKSDFENQLLPIELSEKIINQLEGIVISKKNNEDPIKTAVFLLHKALWEYTETRNRLSKNDLNLNIWLDEIKKVITIHLNKLESDVLIQNKYKAISEKVISGHLDFDESLCIKYWEEDVINL